MFIDHITRLNATLQASTNFRLGIFDYRGDGRRDYQYPRASSTQTQSRLPARAQEAELPWTFEA